MRGGFLHNDVLVGCLRRQAQGLGVRVEAPVRIAGASTCYVDLLLTIDAYRVAVEAECSVRRVLRDLRKAEAIGADELWIVVPHVALARSVRRTLRRAGLSDVLGSTGGKVFVLTQGQSLQRLGELRALISGANGASENRSITQQQAGQRP